MNKTRNLNFDIAKLVAAILIVFIHIPFPGVWGESLRVLARLSVPLFFAITGYFAFQSRGDKIARNLKKIVIIAVSANVLYFVWKLFDWRVIHQHSMLNFVKKICTFRRLARWIFLEEGPLSTHLWYLTSLVILYLLFWGYTTLYKDRERVNYRPLYLIAVGAYMIHLVFSLKMVGAGASVNYFIYRNALFFGLPFFALGLFVREYHARLIGAFRLNVPILLAVFFGGIALGFLQHYRIGAAELPVGMAFSVLAVLLLLTVLPPLRAGNSPAARYWAAVLGSVSLMLYILHPLVKYVCAEVFRLAGVTIPEAINPLLILGLSLILSLLVSMASEGFKFNRKNNIKKV